MSRRRTLLAVAVSAALASSLLAQVDAVSVELGEAVREFLMVENAQREQGAPPPRLPWDRLLAALLPVGERLDAAVLKELRMFVSREHTIPQDGSEIAAARAVWRALADCKPLGDCRNYARLFGGDLENQRGDDQEAVRLWEAAAKWSWLAFDALWRLYYKSEDLRDTARARAALERARVSAGASRLNAFRLHTMECRCSQRMGLFADAYEALAKADAVRDADGVTPADLEVRAIAEFDLALEMGDYPGALQLTRELLAVGVDGATRYRAQLGQAIALGRCGTPGERDAAIRELETMLATCAPSDRAFVRQELAELLLLAGRREQAAEVARQLRIGRGFDDMPAPQRVTAIAGEIAVAIDAVPIAQRQQCVSVLGATWERLRTEWQALPATGGGVAFLQQKFRRNLLSTWFRLEMASGTGGAAARCFEHYLEADSLGSAARRSGRSTPSVADVQALVPSAGVLLAWLPAEFGSFVFVVTPDDVELVPLPSSLGLEVSAADVRQRIHATSGAVPDSLRAALQEMADLLLPERVRARVRAARSLTLAGRELCGGLPFECLPWSDDEAPWLGLAKPIAYLPSLTVGVGLAANAMRTPAAGPMRVFVGAPVGAADRALWHVEALDLPGDWRRSTLAAVAADGVEVLQPAGPSDLLARSAMRPFAGILGHGVQDGRRARQNGLLLAAAGEQGTGAVWPESIEAAGSPARLMFLGVCGAAAGVVKRGEDGAHHLGGALLHAGAAGVILSDHTVYLDTALTTLRVLTASLADARTAADAMLAARRELWRERGALADLASFRYEGLPQVGAALRPAPREAWMRGLLAGLGLLLLGGLAVRFIRHRRGQRSTLAMAKRC